jgi:hypothetical protein
MLKGEPRFVQIDKVLADSRDNNRRYMMMEYCPHSLRSYLNEYTKK